MTLFPAIIVFVIVFLSFSKEILGKTEEPKQKKLKTDGTEPSMSDVLLRYRLMNELQEKS